MLVLISHGMLNWIQFVLGFAAGKGIRINLYFQETTENLMKELPNKDQIDSIVDSEMHATNELKKWLSDLAGDRKLTFVQNREPFKFGKYIELNQVYKLFGDLRNGFDLDAEYEHSFLELDTELKQDYNRLLEKAITEYKETGAPFFNGPNTRLIKIIDTTFQHPRGYEAKSARLVLGPVSWYDYTVLNTNLDTHLQSGMTIRSKYADMNKLMNEDKDLSWCALSNILCVAMIPITKDGFGIVQLRKKGGVSSEKSVYTSGIAENIHRFLDEAHNNLLMRFHSIERRESGETISVDTNYKPKGIPSPYLTAQRGLYEELSPTLAFSTDFSSYRFLAIAFELTKFHPLLIGVIELNYRADEVKEICRQDRGCDFTEGSLDFLELDIDPDRPSRKLLAQLSVEKWVPGGLAAFISALHYWQHFKGRVPQPPINI
ncbi:MAG TPA: hypothetical protein PL103_07475 [Saccharofermentans sp.]|nr:hypothetical protein [Saccharofermentans sp.]